MIPKRAMGTTTSQTAKAAMIHAMRQSTRPMAAPSRMGVNDINTAVAVVMMPKAKPRRRSNQGVTDRVLTSCREPWPSQRMSVNPSTNVTNPCTPLMASRPRPKAMPMSAMARRAPMPSIQRPTRMSATAPRSVPMR